jgi:hypothetical protein
MKASKDSFLLTALMVALVATTAALGGCATGSSSPMPMPPMPVAQNPQLGLAVRVCDSETPDCTGEINFSLSSVRDLQVNADWKNMPGGTHTQEITFLLPNGVVYQTVSHGFGAAEGTFGAPTISDAMPVAGTYITQRELTGDWTVQISLDGAVVGSQKIQLQP